jgi:uncharacterized protein (TIGR04552 family)
MGVTPNGPPQATHEPRPIKRLGDFTLSDLRAVSLILQGESVIDWRRLDLASEEEARHFLAAQEFDLARAFDRERIETIKRAAVDYLQRHVGYPIPRQVSELPTLDLLRLASGKDSPRQLAACVILKAMHIIHHVEARELQYSLALSDQELFRLIEERVYRLVGQMLAEGLPITEFVGGRKRKDSIYTKLLSKREAHSSAVYDKQRFRIVTRTREDILPVLLYLTQNLFPFNYVVPGESINTIFHFRSFCDQNPHLHALARKLGVGDEYTMSDNRFSAQDYRTIHFVVDVPVRVPEAILATAAPEQRKLGPVVFGLCEFQMADSETDEANEKGDASHENYKERQRLAVMRRLELGQARKPRKSLRPKE